MKWAGLSVLVISGCQAEPRSAAFFEAHPDEAQQVVEICRRGVAISSECRAAQTGLAAAEAADRSNVFKKNYE